MGLVVGLGFGSYIIHRSIVRRLQHRDDIDDGTNSLWDVVFYKTMINDDHESKIVHNQEVSMRAVLLNAGRSLLALYFFLPGIMKFIDWDRHVALMETHQMILIPLLLALAGILQIGASVCLFINKQVVVCALGLAAMVLLINVNLHDFWNLYEGVDVKHEIQNFVKNLAIFAGLLLLAAINMDQSSKAAMGEETQSSDV